MSIRSVRVILKVVLLQCFQLSLLPSPPRGFVQDPPLTRGGLTCAPSTWWTIHNRGDHLLEKTRQEPTLVTHIFFQISHTSCACALCDFLRAPPFAAICCRVKGHTLMLPTVLSQQKGGLWPKVWRIRVSSWDATVDRYLGEMRWSNWRRRPKRYDEF